MFRLSSLGHQQVVSLYRGNYIMYMIWYNTCSLLLFNEISLKNNKLHVLYIIIIIIIIITQADLVE